MSELNNSLKPVSYREGWKRARSNFRRPRPRIDNFSMNSTENQRMVLVRTPRSKSNMFRVLLTYLLWHIPKQNNGRHRDE